MVRIDRASVWKDAGGAAVAYAAATGAACAIAAERRSA